MPGSRWAAALLAAVILAQWAVGANYIERTTLPDGPDRVFVLWDDAMISMRFARNLANGHGLVWNPGEEAVQGYTNLGLTLVMAGAHTFPLAREHVALVIQLLALAALSGTLLLTARMVRDLSHDPWAGVGAALALLLCAPHQIYGLQGSDTSFVGLLITAGCAQLVRGWLREGRWPNSAFVFLLGAVLVRPDASLFVVSAAATAVLFPGTRGRGSVAGPLAGLAAVWVGLIAFSLTYYGDPLPNTYYLKTTGAPRLEMWASGFDQLGFLMPGLVPALILTVAGFALAPRTASPTSAGNDRAALCLLAAGILAAAAYHVWVGGDWVRDYGSRHLVQIFPLLLTLSAVGASRLAARFLRDRPLVAGVAALTLASLAGVATNPRYPAREWFVPTTPTLFHLENRMNFMRSRFLERATRPDTRIAVHWGGVGPYFADRPAIDILGRSDRHVARSPAHPFEPGHSKWDWDYLLDVQQPDLIDFESRGLREHPSFRRNYVVLQVGPTAHLFLRRSATDKLTDPALATLPLDDLFGVDGDGGH